MATSTRALATQDASIIGENGRQHASARLSSCYLIYETGCPRRRSRPATKRGASASTQRLKPGRPGSGDGSMPGFAPSRRRKRAPAREGRSQRASHAGQFRELRREVSINSAPNWPRPNIRVTSRHFGCRKTLLVDFPSPPSFQQGISARISGRFGLMESLRAEGQRHRSARRTGLGSSWSDTVAQEHWTSPAPSNSRHKS